MKSNSQTKIKKRKTQKKRTFKTQKRKTSKTPFLKKRGGMDFISKKTSSDILSDYPLGKELTRYLGDEDRHALHIQNSVIDASLGRDCKGLDVDLISIREPQYKDNFWKQIPNPNKGSHVQCWKSNHPPIKDEFDDAITSYLDDNKRDDIIKKWGMIENWNVSQVTDMNCLFSNSDNFNQNIGGWNVSNVKNMEFMFRGADNFNQNIGGWNVSNVTNMMYMFKYAKKFNQDIGGWNVSNVTDMNNMFRDAYNFNQNIGLWNVSKVTDMREMFIDSGLKRNNRPNWWYY